MRNREFIKSFQKGQALLSLLIVSTIGLTIATAAVMILYVNMQSGLKFQEGILAYEIAQSGAENAILRVLRNPVSYTGETITVGDGTATITVTNNSGTYTILSEGRVGDFERKVQVIATFNNNLLDVTSRKEIF